MPRPPPTSPGGVGVPRPPLVRNPELDGPQQEPQAPLKPDAPPRVGLPGVDPGHTSRYHDIYSWGDSVTSSLLRPAPACPRGGGVFYPAALPASISRSSSFL